MVKYKKKKLSEKLKLFVSSTLVSTMLLTHTSPLIVYGAEVAAEEDKSSSVMASESPGSNQEINSLRELTEETEEKSELIVEQLNVLLHTEQQKILKQFLAEENEWTSLFKEAVVAHEVKDFTQAEELYEELIAQIDEQQAVEETEDRLSQETVSQRLELFASFKDLAKQEQPLLAIEDVQPEPTTPPTDTIAESTVSEEKDSKEPGADEDSSASQPAEGEKDVPQTPSPAAFRSAALTVQRSGEEILSETPAHYRGQLKRASDGINTRPWGTTGYQTLRLVGDLVGKEVTVTQEAITNRATWAYVHVRGTHLKGWVDKAGLEVEQILSEKKVHDAVILTRASDGINTRPWGTPGFQTLRTVGDLVGHEVIVTKEAVTQRGTWLYIQINGTDIAGWIDKAGTGPKEILSETAVHYRGQLKRTWDGINTRPWGTTGYQTLRLVGDLVGKEVTVTQEAVTNRATWVYIHVRGTNVQGWVDKAGLEVEQILSEKKVHDAVILTRASDGINTQPWGTPGFQTLRTVGDLVGHEVTVTKEAVTQRGTWLYIQVNGTDIAGWIDKAGTGPKEILSETAVHYRGQLKRTWDGINTRPWGTTGYQTLRLVGDLVGKEVAVTQEAVTNRATWVYIHVRDTNVQGWVDKAGLEAEQIQSEYPVNYRASLTRGYDGINTQPWGTPGYQTIRTVGDLVGREVVVTKEAVTQRSTWAYIQVVGTNLAGWIDKTGLNSKRQVIYLDPGHGGTDTGAYYNGIAEREINLAVSRKIASRLKNLGYEVIMSRDSINNSYNSNATADLYARARRANEMNADIFVSVHHNAMPGSSTVSGIETYYYGPAFGYPPLPENANSHAEPIRLSNSLKLANSIHTELIRATGANNRGVRQGAFVVVREAKMPAVLLELGFMSNPQELSKVTSDSYQNTLADAVVRGVNQYFTR